ncbi:hypothetical protein BDC45DRAFT_569704 [Circinella umbellata]|nr:hypothetical protein BDC45DRAFT_569704 [Circinella umbellata]
MTVDTIYPGVKDVAQVKPFQFRYDVPSSANGLLFAIDDCDIEFATICKIFEKRFGRTSSLKAYRKIPEQDPTVIQAVFTDTKEIKQVLKEASEKTHFTLGSTNSGEVIQATVYCPIRTRDTYTIGIFQDLPLDAPKEIKNKIMEAIEANLSRYPRKYIYTNVDYYITDILLDTTFGQGDMSLTKYYNGKMSLITKNDYYSLTKYPNLHLYNQTFFYSEGGKHHLYCSICKTLDFHDTACCPKDC